MAAPIWEIDPTSEDATNSNLLLVNAPTYILLEQDVPTPPLDPMYAKSADTEGSIPVQVTHQNRTITLKLRITGTSASALETTLSTLAQKIDKLRREGGTLKHTTPTTDTVVFDVISASHTLTLDRRYTRVWMVECVAVFECRPYGLGAWVTNLSDHAETTNPVLVFTETGITGDVPALGRLVVDEDDADSQFWVMWGLQSRYYDSDADAALYFASTGRALLGGSQINGSTVESDPLTSEYTAILSTNASGGSPMQHVGTFRVWAQVNITTAFTDTLLALDWSTNSFTSFTRNYAQTIESGAKTGQPFLIDFGIVELPKVAQGTQAWEGRFLALGAGNVAQIKHIILQPVAEGSGEVSGVFQTSAPTAYTAQDGFAQTSGALTGKTAAIGGTWAASTGPPAQDTTDFQVDGSGTITRTATSDSGTTPVQGRLVQLPQTMTATAVQIDHWADTANNNASWHAGVVARWADNNNFIRAYAEVAKSLSGFRINAYTVDVVASGTSTTQFSDGGPTAWADEIEAFTLRLVVDAGGRWRLFVGPQGGTLSPIGEGYHSALATGGALDDGRPGIWDYHSDANAATRNYDNFAAWAPVTDAAMFASQSLEIRHDRVIREDSSGTYWQKPSSYDGRYLLIPPAGAESRTVRIMVKGCRNNPRDMSDPGTDDISAKLYYRPRYLILPS